jgi:hypothetical protein
VSSVSSMWASYGGLFKVIYILIVLMLLGIVTGCESAREDSSLHECEHGFDPTTIGYGVRFSYSEEILSGPYRGMECFDVFNPSCHDSRYLVIIDREPPGGRLEVIVHRCRICRDHIAKIENMLYDAQALYDIAYGDVELR